MKRYVLALVYLLSLQASATDIYKIVIDNKTKKKVYLETESVIAGLDYKIPGKIVVNPETRITEEGRVGTDVTVQVTRVYNDFEICQLKNLQIPAKITTVHENAAPETARFTVEKIKNKKFACQIVKH